MNQVLSTSQISIFRRALIFCKTNDTINFWLFFVPQIVFFVALLVAVAVAAPQDASAKAEELVKETIFMEIICINQIFSSATFSIAFFGIWVTI